MSANETKFVDASTEMALYIKPDHVTHYTAYTDELTHVFVAGREKGLLVKGSLETVHVLLCV